MYKCDVCKGAGFVEYETEDNVCEACEGRGEVPEFGEMVTYRELPPESEQTPLPKSFWVPAVRSVNLTQYERDQQAEELGLFIYDPFGRGSLLEQAVNHIVNKALLNQRKDMFYISKASRMLNEIIDREMKLMGIVIEERFLFETMNEYGSGGWMRVHDTAGREYLKWSI